MNPLRSAARALLRARGFTVATLLTIALTTAAACAVFGVVNTVLERPLPYPHASRIVGMWHTLPGLDIPTAKQSPGTYAMYRESARSFEAMALYLSLAATIGYQRAHTPPERVRAGWVTPSAFAVLGARPLIGRLLTDADAARGATPVVLISEQLWRTRFEASRSIVGQTIDVDGVRQTIVGVMPADFAFPEARTPIWGPLDVANPTYLGSFGSNGIGLLRPGVSLAAAQHELAQILTQAPRRFAEQRPGVSTTFVLQKSRMAPVLHTMRDDVVGGFEHVIWLITGAVALLVVVALSTVASLQVVRIQTRQREFAVRAALGASRGTLCRALVAETTLLAGLGGGGGLVVAAFVLGAVGRLAPAGVPRANEIHLDGAVILAGAALTALFATVSVAIGLMRIGAQDNASLLRDGGRSVGSGRAAQRLRATFVGVQVAMSLVLLAGAGVVGRSTVRLLAIQPGFDPSNLFTFWTFLPATSYKTPDDAARFYREAIARMQRLPGVVSVAATAKLPLEVEGFPYRLAIWGDDGTGATTSFPPVVQATTTTRGYFDTMRIPMIAGRSYDDANVRRGALEAVASRGYVQQMWHDATGRAGIGKRLRPTATGPWFTIVGVVGDVRDSTLTLPAVSEVYFPEEPNGDTSGNASTTGRDMAFVVRMRGGSAEVPAALRRALHALDPTLPFHRPASMDQIVSESGSRLRLALAVLGAGAGITLLLGIVGLYGTLAYIVSLRSREISIRIALGLDPARAVSIVVRHGATIVLAGVAGGGVMFLLFTRLLGSLTFDVPALDPLTLLGSATTVVTISILAAWIPARRAGRVNPADALKAD